MEQKTKEVNIHKITIKWAGVAGAVTITYATDVLYTFFLVSLSTNDAKTICVCIFYVCDIRLIVAFMRFVVLYEEVAVLLV